MSELHGFSFDISHTSFKFLHIFSMGMDEDESFLYLVRAIHYDLHKARRFRPVCNNVCLVGLDKDGLLQECISF